MQQRRSTGRMPVRQRHLGLTAVDRRDEEKQWNLLIAFLGILLGLVVNAANLPLLIIGVAQANAMAARAAAMRSVGWDVHPDIDKVFFFLRFSCMWMSLMCIILARLMWTADWIPSRLRNAGGCSDLKKMIYQISSMG